MELSNTESNTFTPFARILTAIALALAVVCDLLFFNQYIGVNAPMMTVLFLLVIVGMYDQRDRSVLKAPRFVYSLLIVLATSMMLVIRDSVPLSFLNSVFFMIGLVGILHPKQTFVQTLNDFLTPVASLVLPITHFFSAIFSFSTDPVAKQQRQKIIRGLVLSLPLLLVFIVLFSAADAIFGEVIQRMLRYVDQPEFLLHLGLIGVVTLILLGCFGIALRSQFMHVDSQTSALLREQRVSQFPETEFLIVFCVLNAVFLLFLLSQFGYLFIADSAVTSIAHSASYIVERNTTYAQHARNGFFQLLIATGIATGIVIVVEKFRRMQPLELMQAHGRTLEFLSVVLLVQVFFVDISAFWRLWMYIDAYGLTQLRFYSLIGIPVIALIIVVLIWILLKQQRLLFLMQGTMAIFTGTVLMLNIISPEKMIVYYNIGLFERTGKIDVAYLQTLSLDAAPAVLQANGPVREEIAKAIKVPGYMMYIDLRTTTYRESVMRDIDSRFKPQKSDTTALFGLNYRWPSWHYAAWQAERALQGE